jgi:hypothetical protein
MKYVRKAQMNQPASAANVPQKSPETPILEMAPTPAATLERITAVIACPVVCLSASTSS